MPITINGDGTITGISAGGLPDAIITQPELAAGVAGNGPAFSAYPNAGQVIASGTYTKLLFQAEEFDTNSNFASSTFTPTVAGYYQVTVGFVAPSASRAAEVQLLFYKNAVAFKTGTDLVTASTIISTMSALIYLNGTTDYLDCYVYLGTGGTTIPSASTLYFQAAMVRSA